MNIPILIQSDSDNNISVPLAHTNSQATQKQDDSSLKIATDDPQENKDSPGIGQNKVSTIRQLWRIFLLFSHYGNYITDVLTVRDMWINGYYYYFGIFIFLMVCSWILSTWFICKYIGVKKGLFLCLTHLDYAYFIFTEIASDEKTEAVKYRKLFTLVCQSGPGVFLTAHSVFVGGNIGLTTQISMAFTIFEVALSCSLYSEYKEKFVTVNFSKSVAGDIAFPMIYIVIDSAAKLYMWGFLCALTRPLGVWIYFPVTIIAAIIVIRIDPRTCVNDWEDPNAPLETKFIWPILIMSVFIGNISIPNGRNGVKITHRIFEYFSFGIVWVIFRENLMAIVGSAALWEAYFIVSIVCVALFMVLSLCWICIAPSYA